MTIPAPFDRYEGEVLPEWIDANDHMNLAYYTVLFDYATDLLFDVIGIGRQYKDSTNKGTFVVETHNSYERELLVGDRVRLSTQILAMDAKRLHLAHEMFKASASDDRLGIPVRIDGDKIHYAYPVTILAAQRPTQ